MNETTTFAPPAIIKSDFEISPEFSQLFTAMAKAQSEIVGAKKDSRNPFFKSSYADLASCWDACRDALAKNGFCVFQIPLGGKDGTLTLKTVVGHAGEFISGTFSVPVEPTAQAYGSMLTYMRRYALTSIVGIAQVDDDGESTMRREVPLITENQAADLAALIDEVGADKALFLKWAKVNRIEDIRSNNFDYAIKRLKDKSK